MHEQEAPEDPLLDLAVERALDPYRAILTPELCEQLRQTMRFGLATHPRAQEILRQLRTRQAVDQSGKRPTAAFSDLDEEQPEQRGLGRSR